jgi:hypothetical protein
MHSLKVKSYCKISTYNHSSSYPYSLVHLELSLVYSTRRYVLTCSQHASSEDRSSPSTTALHNITTTYHHANVLNVSDTWDHLYIFWQRRSCLSLPVVRFARRCLRVFQPLFVVTTSRSLMAGMPAAS